MELGGSASLPLARAAWLRGGYGSPHVGRARPMVLHEKVRSRRPGILRRVVIAFCANWLHLTSNTLSNWAAVSAPKLAPGQDMASGSRLLIASSLCRRICLDHILRTPTPRCLARDLLRCSSHVPPLSILLTHVLHMRCSTVLVPHYCWNRDPGSTTRSLFLSIDRQSSEVLHC